MAWWNQPEGSVTPTVTLRRLAAWFAERGYGYDMDLSEGVVRSRVAGFDYVLMVVDRRILVVRAHHQFDGPAPGPAELSRVRAVAQEVSSGRLIPALYTEVDDAGLALCAEALTNIGVGLDDAQLAGTMDFILEGIDGALREVLSLLAAEDADADEWPAVGPEAETEIEPEPQAESEPETETDVEGDRATVIVLPDAPQSIRPTGDTGTAAATGGEPVRESAQTPAGAMVEGMPADMSDATVEMAAVVDGLGPGAPGDTEGGTGAETTDTSKPLLVS